MAGFPGFTVTVMELLVAVVGEAQVAFDVKITDTTSPSTRPVVEKVELLPPAFTPFTCH
jgi:hypothetical protein